MNLAQLRALQAIANEGSITDAALALGLTQSAVSHTLASLERELDMSLVHRDRAGSTLTDAAKALMPDVDQALVSVGRIADVAAATKGKKQGLLRIGAFPTACQILPPLIALLNREHPDIDVTLLEGQDDEVLEWLDHNVIDVGVVTEKRPDLHTVPLARDEMVVITASNHPLAGNSQITVGRLAREPFLLSTGGCERIIRSIYKRSGVEFVVGRRVTHMTTLLAMVREGLGVSIVPTLSLTSTLDGIKAIPLRPRAPRELLLATVSNREPSPATQAFLTTANAELRSQH